jgi:predicted enzyme involved in methoxymalonyl-ACP biosynthesis
MRKTNHRNQIAAAKKNKTAEEPAILKIDDPPLSVVDVKAYRLAVSIRNSALKKAQSKFINELVIFDDISENGVTATEERERAQEKIALEKREEEKKLKEALEEWTNTASAIKIESINWGAIHREA